MTRPIIRHRTLSAPPGRLAVAWREPGEGWADSLEAPEVLAVDFRGDVEAMLEDLNRRFPDAMGRRGSAGATVPATIRAYLEGDLGAPEGLATTPGGTSFQSRVWQELRGIAPGTTISYGELARRVGSPKGSRAVGRANGANPIPVVIPCHRVIGADGSLTGFGGGLEWKRWLLDHEQIPGQLDLPGV